MRYLLPILVCAALGALVIVLVKWKSEPERSRDDTNAVETTEGPPAPTTVGTTSPLGKPRETRTALEQNKWLSELERVMGREDMNRAGYYRQKVCEEMETILADATLRNNLLQLIRDNLATDDLARRDVVLGILRVFAHPDATALLASEYYNARNEDEKMMMLEGMAHTYHDPKTAAVWSIHIALNSENKEHRDRAFEIVFRQTKDDKLILDTAFQIWESTPRHEQSSRVMGQITRFGVKSQRVRDFVRGQMAKAGPEAIAQCLGDIEAWATEEDAVRLDNLGDQYPEMKDIFTERAFAIREARKNEGPPPDPIDIPGEDRG